MWNSGGRPNVKDCLGKLTDIKDSSGRLRNVKDSSGRLRNVKDSSGRLPYVNYSSGRMPSSGMLRRVALVRTDISEERITPVIRVTRIAEVVTANVVPSSPILVTLMREALCSFETSVLTRATRRNIP
jgi:hypothetical protein